MQVLLTNDKAKQVTIGYLKDKLEIEIMKDKTERMKLLFGLCALSEDISKADIATEDHVSLFAVACSLYSSLFLEELDYPLIDEDTPELFFNKDFGKKVAEAAEGVVPDDYFNEDGSPNSEVMHLDWLATLTNNSLFQGDTFHEITNIMILCGLKGYKGLAANPGPINSIFQSKTGNSAENYFRILFSLWCMSLNKFFVNTNTLFKNSSIPEELKEIAEAILEDLSIEIKNGHTKLQFADIYSGKAKPMAIFCRLPLIKVSPVHYLFSGQPFLKVQVTSKFLNKALQFARDVEGRGSTEFSSYLGKDRFEDYFFELTKDWLTKNDYKREYRYLSNNTDLSPDFICLEKHGSSNVAHLFQLKLKMPTEKTIYGHSFEDVDRDLNKFSELIYKSIQYLYKLHVALENGTLDNETKEYSIRVLAAKHCCLFGVIPTSPSIFSTIITRKRILKSALENISQDELEWFTRKYANGKRFHWYIFSLPDFQSFLGLPEEKQHLFKEFKRYIQNSEIDKVLIKKNYIPPDFRSYLYKYHSNKKYKIKYNEELHSIFDKYFEEIIDFLKLDPNKT